MLNDDTNGDAGLHSCREFATIPEEVLDKP